jgi:hypothetical protein
MSGKLNKLSYHREQSTVKLTVTPGSPLVGVIEKCEIQEGVKIAASLTKVVDG